MTLRRLLLVLTVGLVAGQYSKFYRKVPRRSSAYDLITKAILPEPASSPDYNYNYVVSDPYSGDRKSHQETRHGNVVQGRYSFMDADGTIRIVEYFVDSIRGYNAVVRKVPVS